MSKSEIKIIFETDGGAGTQFVYANFIYCFRKWLGEADVKIAVLGNAPDELNEILYGDGDFVDEYYPMREKEITKEYDAHIFFRFFPIVKSENEAIRARMPWLHDLLERWRRFTENSIIRKAVLRQPFWDFNVYQRAEILDKNVLDITDIDGILGVPKHFVLPVRNLSDTSFLEGFSLVENEYITFQCGATPKSYRKESPKAWSKEKFLQLIPLLKKAFPEKKIVQLGEKSNSEVLQDVDVNLLGRTTWRQLGTVLKGAWLHIDGECGMVQYRTAMHGGPSVVLFGVTPVDFYGFDENINIRTEACPRACARLSDEWLDRCVRGMNPPLCMDSITPEMVMERINEWRKCQEEKI